MAPALQTLVICTSQQRIMKTTFTFFITALLLVNSLSAQTTYTITKSESWDNKASYPNPCFKCTFDLASNAVLTIERDVTFSDVVFNGGTVVVDKKDLTLWTNGGKNQFNSTKFIFNGNGQLTSGLTGQHIFSGK